MQVTSETTTLTTKKIAAGCYEITAICGETEINAAVFKRSEGPGSGQWIVDMGREGQRTEPTPQQPNTCLLYTSPSPRDRQKSRMPSSA